MNHKLIFNLFAMISCVSTSAFAFVVINQTDVEKIVTIDEATPVAAKTPEEIIEEIRSKKRTQSIMVMPKSVSDLILPTINGTPTHRLVVPAKSIVHFTLNENCQALLVSVESKLVEKSSNKTNEYQSKVKTYHRPYSYIEDEQMLTFDDDWGIVFYVPQESVASNSIFQKGMSPKITSEVSMKSSTSVKTSSGKKQSKSKVSSFQGTSSTEVLTYPASHTADMNIGYGIMVLHPEIVKEASIDKLPFIQI